jgi:hypothetical protein
MKRRIFGWAILVAMTATLIGCGGSDGAQGPAGPPGAPAPTAAAVAPEQCVLCHVGDNPVARTGPGHQAIYEQFYQDGIVKVVTGSMAFSATRKSTSRAASTRLLAC